MTGGIALILGKIGRNFAAGMSGGIAYIFKSNNEFRSDNFNMEMIEFEKLDKQDYDIIKNLLEKHYSYTHSSIAEKIIANFDIDFVYNKLQQKQKEVCEKYDFTPSDSVWLASTDNSVYDKFKRGERARLCLAPCY